MRRKPRKQFDLREAVEKAVLAYLSSDEFGYHVASVIESRVISRSGSLWRSLVPDTNQTFEQYVESVVQARAAAMIGGILDGDQVSRIVQGLVERLVESHVSRLLEPPIEKAVSDLLDLDGVTDGNT